MSDCLIELGTEERPRTAVRCLTQAFSGGVRRL